MATGVAHKRGLWGWMLRERNRVCCLFACHTVCAPGVQRACVRERRELSTIVCVCCGEAAAPERGGYA